MRQPRTLRGRRAAAAGDDPGVRGREHRSVRARRRDRRVVQHRQGRRGRARLHLLLPPREPRRGAPASARSARAGRQAGTRGCRRHRRRGLRTVAPRGGRRGSAAPPRRPAVPPRLHRAPHRGAAPGGVGQRPPPVRTADAARCVQRRRRRAAPRASSDAGRGRHALAHRSPPRPEALAHRRGAHSHVGVR